jgi:quercetin dioxygenase-like cupin family protein
MGSRIAIRVPSEATDGAFSVVEVEAPPGFRAPPTRHRHPDVDWYGAVQEGEVAIELDGHVARVPAGSVVVVPRGVAFRWSNASDDEPVRLTFTYVPGGFERFFVDLVDGLKALDRAPTGADMARMAPPLWARHGVEVVE